jgi:putative addiction module antidote
MKIRKIGASLGVIIPKEELNRMHLKEGDEIFGLPVDDGLLLQARDPLFERKMKAFENTHRQFRNDLRELAK